MKATLALIAASLFLSLSPAPLRSAEWSGALEQILKVGPEGAGNAEAARAWGELTAHGSEVILPVLEAMETAGPIARNWMRSAVETVFERELAAKPLADFLPASGPLVPPRAAAPAAPAPVITAPVQKAPVPGKIQPAAPALTLPIAPPPAFDLPPPPPPKTAPSKP